jgi:RNA polymerase sigma-54 factor
MFQVHYQEIRPLTTAHLAQTMTLLSLTAEEIREQIESELASNPALELKEERRCPTCYRPLPDRGPCPICSHPHTESPDEPVVFVSPRDDFNSNYKSSDSDYTEENDFSPTVDDLPTYVLRQIAPELEVQDRKLAAYLLAHLDEDGFLTIEPYEIANYQHVAISRVENVRSLIQHADPLGVGSRNPQEAMTVQLDALAENKPVPDLARLIIEKGFELLCKRHLKELAHQFGTSLHQIQLMANFIGENLNPFPGRTNWGDERQPCNPGVQVYHRPDVILSYLNDDPQNPIVVEIIMPIKGILRVNPAFRSVVKQASKEEKVVWKTDLERASLFVKCLQQRNHTMKRLLQIVVRMQRNFILHGPKYIMPITRVRLSEELEVHESTISRAVSNKTVQLPNRQIIPLASFFDRSLNVRTVLRDLISSESSPLSDAQLVNLLAQEGHLVARRTVAKYRAMEGILPAHLRRSMIQVS